MTIIITASALFFMISMPEKESFNGIDRGRHPHKHTVKKRLYL